jgi:hypothetical protein
LLICLAQLPPDLVPKIQGGLAGTEDDGKNSNAGLGELPKVIYADYLVEMTISG